MPLTVGAKISKNEFPVIADRLRPSVDAAIRKACADIAGGAATRTMRVLTGAMKSGYRFERVADLEWIVYNLMHYHIYHEIGTIHIAAMPMLVPSLEAVRPVYVRAITAILSRGVK